MSTWSSGMIAASGWQNPDDNVAGPEFNSRSGPPFLSFFVHCSLDHTPHGDIGTVLDLGLKLFFRA